MDQNEWENARVSMDFKLLAHHYMDLDHPIVQVKILYMTLDWTILTFIRSYLHSIILTLPRRLKQTFGNIRRSDKSSLQKNASVSVRTKCNISQSR